MLHTGRLLFHRALFKDYAKGPLLLRVHVGKLDAHPPPIRSGGGSSSTTSPLFVTWRRRLAASACSGEGWERETAGLTSLLRSGGWAGRKSGLASRSIRTAPHRWWPRSWERRPLAASAKAVSISSDAGTRSRPTRRPDQAPSATDAVVGATFLYTVQQTPGVPSVQRTTPRKITGAPSRCAGRDEAAGAHMRLPSAPTERALMGRGPRPAPPRRKTANSREGGGPLPARAGGGGALPWGFPEAGPRPPRRGRGGRDRG